MKSLRAWLAVALLLVSGGAGAQTYRAPLGIGASTGNWLFAGNNLSFPAGSVISSIGQGAAGTIGVSWKANVANSATSVQFVYDTATAQTTSGNVQLSIRDVGSEWLFFDKVNQRIIFDSGSLGRIGNAAVSIGFGGSGMNFSGYAAPAIDNTSANGFPGQAWSQNDSWRYITGNQIIAAAASITVAPGSGDYVRINLSATAITSLTISAGTNGEEMIVEVVEDATGTRTIPTTWTNVALAGGSYTASTTANFHDVITFVYNSTLAKWVETGRALAVR